MSLKSGLVTAATRAAFVFLALASGDERHTYKPTGENPEGPAGLVVYGRNAMTKKTITGYMCNTDFHDELGHADDGNTVYPSLNAIRRERPCVEQCGVAEVKVTFVREVTPFKYPKTISHERM